MKKAISIGLQAVLMLIANAIGFLEEPFHAVQVTHTVLAGPMPNSGTYSSHMILTARTTYLWDGVFLMLIVYGLILVVEAICKRLPRAAVVSTIALLVAAVLGFVAGFGTPFDPLQRGMAREAVVAEDARVMRSAVQAYTVDKAAAPKSPDELVSAGYLRAIPGRTPIYDVPVVWPALGRPGAVAVQAN